MKLFKLTALTSLLFVFVIGTSSCEKNAEKKIQTDYSKLAIPLTGANVSPTSASPALGVMDVFYTKETRILNYSITWSGLSGPVSSMHIHGLAPTGYSTATITQNIIASSNGIATPSNTLYPATGKFSGTLLADGVVVKEQDLLNGMYYLDIHTAAYPNGEIRAQITFQ